MDQLRLGIDATVLSKQLTGIGRYLLEICRQLDILLPEARFFLYSPEPLAIRLPSDRWIARQEGARVAQLASSYAWLKLYARKMAEADDIDIFWAPRTILPARSRAFRTVATVHDLNYRIVPSSMPSGTLWVHRFWFAGDSRRADAVVTNSQGTADRLRDMLGIAADGVALPGVTDGFEPQLPKYVSARLAAFKISGPYFLAVGTLEPRKNLSALIEAFVSLKRDGKLGEHNLLFVGSQGWRDRKLCSLLAEVRELGGRWLGFVPDEDLAVLYAGATAFIFPSMYEGFGIPALEARACGARVVASNIPELRESGGPEGIYIAPTIDGIRAGLLTAMQAPKPTVAKPEDWVASAEVMACIFRRLHEA